MAGDDQWPGQGAEGQRLKIGLFRHIDRAGHDFHAVIQDRDAKRLKIPAQSEEPRHPPGFHHDRDL